MSDPECPDCIAVVHQSLTVAEKSMSAYYEGIPGVTHLRETWERLQKAAADQPEQDLITVTGMSDGDTLEELARRAVREALGKDPAEENMITITE